MRIQILVVVFVVIVFVVFVVIVFVVVVHHVHVHHIHDHHVHEWETLRGLGEEKNIALKIVTFDDIRTDM